MVTDAIGCSGAGSCSLSVAVPAPVLPATVHRFGGNLAVVSDAAGVSGGRSMVDFNTGGQISYIVDNVIGGVGGNGASFATPGGSLKPGFAGTLFEVAAIDVLADATNLPEETATQVHATCRLDDGSQLQPDGRLVWWGTTGPLTNVVSDNLGISTVLARAVYEDEAAAVTANFLNPLAAGQDTIIVRNTDKDNFGALAHDGIDDLWEVRHNIMPQNLYLDPDGDGIPNFAEAAFNLDPNVPDTNSPSHFELVTVDGVRYMQMTYRRYVGHPGIHIETLVTPGLSTPAWTTNGVEQVSADMLDDNTEEVTMRHPAPLGTEPASQFMQLRVTLSP
jgi:hypothetical protein